jgi:hypothetical protein
VLLVARSFKEKKSRQKERRAPIVGLTRRTRGSSPASRSAVRIDGEAGKARDAHAHDVQAGELGQEPAHELPWAHAQIKSAQARTGAQELHDRAKEREVVVVPDECEAEGLKVSRSSCVGAPLMLAPASSHPASE